MSKPKTEQVIEAAMALNILREMAAKSSAPLAAHKQAIESAELIGRNLLQLDDMLTREGGIRDPKEKD